MAWIWKVVQSVAVVLFMYLFNKTDATIDKLITAIEILNMSRVKGEQEVIGITKEQAEQKKNIEKQEKKIDDIEEDVQEIKIELSKRNK